MRTKGETMKSKALILVLAVSLLAGLAGSGTSALAAKKKASGPVVVGTDAADDWGSNVDPTIAPAGDLLGQELVEARMGMADKETVEFIIQLNSLPPWGGIPESSRYGWDFTVDGEAYGMSGAFTEVVRGMCNPLITDPACPPNVGDPAQLTDAPFFIRNGACTVGAGGPADCNVVAIINSVFDPAEATITIPVPLEAIEAKPGSKIAPGTSFYGGTIYAAPALLVGLAAGPVDTMIVTETFVVASGKKGNKGKKR